MRQSFLWIFLLLATVATAGENRLFADYNRQELFIDTAYLAGIGKKGKIESRIGLLESYDRHDLETTTQNHLFFLGSRYLYHSDHGMIYGGGAEIVNALLDYGNSLYDGPLTFLTLSFNLGVPFYYNLLFWDLPVVNFLTLKVDYADASMSREAQQTGYQAGELNYEIKTGNNLWVYIGYRSITIEFRDKRLDPLIYDQSSHLGLKVYF